MKVSEKTNSSKSNHSNSYIKCEWTEHPIQQTEPVSLDKRETCYAVYKKRISD